MTSCQFRAAIPVAAHAGRDRTASLFSLAEDENIEHLQLLGVCEGLDYTSRAGGKLTHGRRANRKGIFRQCGCGLDAVRLTLSPREISTVQTMATIDQVASTVSLATMFARASVRDKQRERC